MSQAGRRVVVIGAGVGGLTAAALLLRAGYQVVVLESQSYPGGSAGTFYHKGYRFDAGATLAGGFAANGPHARLAHLLGLRWPATTVDPAWVVHLPGCQTIHQWSDPAGWQAERQAIFPHHEPFWQIQEKLATIAWDISSRSFPWPPESAKDWLNLAAALRPSVLPALPYLGQRVAGLLPGRDPLFKTFLDSQLLIAAQTTTDFTNALYGSAALDLPRRGVNYLQGGMGAIAQTLADWITANGGQLLYRQRAEKALLRSGRMVAVQTNRQLTVEGDWFVANLTPGGLAALLGDLAPSKLQREMMTRPEGWGAFTLYLGLEASQLPAGIPDHHQVIVDPTKPLGEGNSVFISLSPANDSSRAPAGMRAATLSTHTAIQPWWDLVKSDENGSNRFDGRLPGYFARRDLYSQRLLAAGEQAIPGLRAAVGLCLPGTPLTFQFYTLRPGGLVGGFPQTSLFNVRGPATGIPNVKLVGDSIFPGQSTAGVTLGAMRVAAGIIQ